MGSTDAPPGSRDQRYVPDQRVHVRLPSAIVAVSTIPGRTRGSSRPSIRLNPGPIVSAADTAPPRVAPQVRSTGQGSARMSILPESAGSGRCRSARGSVQCVTDDERSGDLEETHHDEPDSEQHGQDVNRFHRDGDDHYAGRQAHCPKAIHHPRPGRDSGLSPTVSVTTPWTTHVIPTSRPMRAQVR